MDIKNSFPRLKKKVKHLGRNRKPGIIGADVYGESANPTNPPPRPGPHVVADGDGNGAGDTDGQQSGSAGQPTQPDEPELLPVNECEDNRGGGEAGVDWRNVSPMYSYPHPHAEVGAGSGPDREGNEVDGEKDGKFYSCSSTHSIQHSGESDGNYHGYSRCCPHQSLRQHGQYCS